MPLLIRIFEENINDSVIESWLQSIITISDRQFQYNCNASLKIMASLSGGSNAGQIYNYFHLDAGPPFKRAAP